MDNESVAATFRQPALWLRLAAVLLPLALFAPPARSASDAIESLLDMSFEQLIDIVTVRKREERSIDVPVAVTSFSEQALDDYGIRSFADYASMTPNLSFAYGNGLTAGNAATAWSSSRTIAVRGIAGAGTTGVYIDDIPLPGSVNVRLLDLQRIDVLKGPQGTLFGQGSLGGNIRLLAQPPSLDDSSYRYRLTAGQTAHGATPNWGAEAVGNVVLSPGTAGLRLSIASDDDAGYIKRSYLSDIANPASPRRRGDDQGAQRNLAGSITALVRATADLDISARVIYQSMKIAGFPATWAPLPAFVPQYTMDRQANLQSQANDSWTLPSLLMTYRGRGWTLSSSTGLFDRHTYDLEDSTEGTLQIYGGAVLPQPTAWPALFTSRQFSHETRIAFDPVDKLSGTVGVYYSQHKTDYLIPPVYDALSVPPLLLWTQSDANTQQDFSLFGELYYPLGDRWTLTVGDRIYWLKQRDSQTVIGDAGQTTYKASAGANGNSPKLALSYQASASAMLYGSATKGFRQGNTQLDPSAFASCATSLAALGETAASFKAIEPSDLWSYEAGGKFEWPKPGVVLSVAAFHIDWKHPQQQVLLQSCGLFAQGDGGGAKVDGGELELSGYLAAALKARLGLGYEDARTTKNGHIGEPVGSRIDATPRWTASLGAVYAQAIDDRLTARIAADYSFTGNSGSSNNGPFRLVRPAYATINLGIGVNWAKSELRLRVRNLADAKPNLGDITYIGYGLYSDAGRTNPIPQVATLPPRTLTLQYSVYY